MSEFGIHFGALAPTIAEQLQEAGVQYDEEKIDHCDRDAKAISRLHVRGLLPDSQAGKARKKLMRNVEECLVPPTEATRKEESNA